MTTSTQLPASRRERARTATIEEIKQTALDLMREARTTDIRFTDIAKSMGLTPPALYRYFDGRDELLTQLITDSYDELGEHIRRSLEGLDESRALGPLGRRRPGLPGAGPAQAPERFALILGMPVPGYCRRRGGARPPRRPSGRCRSCPACSWPRQERGELRPPLIREVDPALAACGDREAPGGRRGRPARPSRSRRCCTPGPGCTASPAWRPTATWTGSAGGARRALPHPARADRDRGRAADRASRSRGPSPRRTASGTPRGARSTEPGRERSGPGTRRSPASAASGSPATASST